MLRLKPIRKVQWTWEINVTWRLSAYHAWWSLTALEEH